MKLTQVPNLRTEDFPSEQTWISKLFIQLNPFIQTLFQILNNRVDFSTNIRSITKTFTNITTFQSTSFSWPYNDTPPVDLRVIQATSGTDQTPTILLVAWSYNSTERSITLSRMVEVNATSVSALSGTYNFSIRVTV